MLMWRTRRRTQPCILLLDMVMPLSPRPWPVMELTSCVGAQGACYLYTWPVSVATLTVWRHSCLVVSVCLSVLCLFVGAYTHGLSVCLSYVCLFGSVHMTCLSGYSDCVETLLPRSKCLFVCPLFVHMACLSGYSDCEETLLPRSKCLFVCPMFVCLLGPVHMVGTLTVWRHSCLAVSVCLSFVCLFGSVHMACLSGYSDCVET